MFKFFKENLRNDGGSLKIVCFSNMPVELFFLVSFCICKCNISRCRSFIANQIPSVSWILFTLQWLCLFHFHSIPNASLLYQKDQMSCFFLTPNMLPWRHGWILPLFILSVGHMPEASVRVPNNTFLKISFSSSNFSLELKHWERRKCTHQLLLFSYSPAGACFLVTIKYSIHFNLGQLPDLLWHCKALQLIFESSYIFKFSLIT